MGEIENLGTLLGPFGDSSPQLSNNQQSAQVIIREFLFMTAFTLIATAIVAKMVDDALTGPSVYSRKNLASLRPKYTFFKFKKPRERDNGPGLFHHHFRSL